MNKLSSGGVSVGYKKISEESKKYDKTLTQDYCRKIKKELERLGILETRGTKTYIIKSEELMKA